MNEKYSENGNRDERIDNGYNKIRIELPRFNLFSSEEEKTKVLVEKIETLPLDEQEQYWQIMDDESLSFNEKVILINELIGNFNSDNKE